MSVCMHAVSGMCLQRCVPAKVHACKGACLQRRIQRCMPANLACRPIGAQAEKHVLQGCCKHARTPLHMCAGGLHVGALPLCTGALYPLPVKGKVRVTWLHLPWPAKAALVYEPGIWMQGLAIRGASAPQPHTCACVCARACPPRPPQVKMRELQGPEFHRARQQWLERHQPAELTDLQEALMASDSAAPLPSLELQQVLSACLQVRYAGSPSCCACVLAGATCGVMLLLCLRACWCSMRDSAPVNVRAYAGAACVTCAVGPGNRHALPPLLFLLL